MNRDKMLIPTVILDEVKAHGVQIVNYSKIDADHFVRAPHRDTDYLFAFAYKGFLKLIVDFHGIFIPKNQSILSFRDRFISMSIPRETYGLSRLMLS